MDDETESIVIVLSIYITLGILCMLTCYIYVKILKHNKREIDLENYDLYVINAVEYDNEIPLPPIIQINEDCCICLEPMEHNLTKTKCCNQYLHNKCLVDYIIFKYKNRLEIICPLCRSKI